MDIKKPQNIFELINANIVAISEDLNTMHAKIDRIYNALYPNEEGHEKPTADGETHAGSEIVGE